MAMTFGKGNRSIAFNPTSAFPLDARSYFESYQAALEAASRAAMAGDTNTEYYFGQTVVVVEGGTATPYIIQPTKTLVPLALDDGSKIIINANQFEFNDKGQLILKGSETAAKGSLASIDENGMLHWVAPIDAYTKSEVDSLIANASHIKRKIVANLKEIQDYIDNNNDAELYIFMVPTGFELEADKYDEYMVVFDGEEYVIEKVGSWEVNLDAYAKTEDVTAALNDKVDKAEGYRLISDAEITKLLNIEENAEANYISSVTNDFAVKDGQLELQNLPISKITDLEQLLAGKVNTQEGWTLLSPANQEKLAKLEIQNGNLEISGTVNASSVLGLEQWLNDHKSSVEGLSEKNFTQSLYDKLTAMLSITAVNENELKVEEGTLSITAIDMSKITGLDDALKAKADQAAVTTQIATAVESLTAKLNDYVTKEAHKADIDALWDALTWKEIN